MSFPKVGVRAVIRFKESGFTLVEVLVGMMISMIFLSITMQIFVAAAFLRAQSTKYNDAYNWVQEDFEQLLSKAQNYQLAASPYPAQCDAETPDDGLAASFLQDVMEGETVNFGPRDFGGKSFMLTRMGDYSQTTSPDRLLNIRYSITPVNGGPDFFSLDTKVVLYAAFKCPN